MSTFIEKTDSAFSLQLTNFANKISAYQTTFGLTNAQIASIKADALAYAYVISCLSMIETFAHNYNQYKHELRHDKTVTLGGFPALPVFPPAPAAVLADIEARFRAFIQLLVHNPNKAYTVAIGQDLGIVSPLSVFDPAHGKPQFTLELTAGGHPHLHYTKGDFDGVEVWKDSGAGFLKLERVTLPTYTDPTALPSANVAALWRYKMIFVYKDAIVGDYSDIVSITVHGQTGPNPTTQTPANG
ncbi:MAG: hypothetical protein ACYDCN_10405 [Bacteroidia bacterium]